MHPDIYHYIDYRQFLVDVFTSLSTSDPEVSFRSFARMAGSTSPNFLQLVRDRKLNIHDDTITALAQSLMLKKKETEFFRVLVAFDQAKTHAEKDEYFKYILRKREYKSIATLTKEQFQFFSHWYIPVIRELIVRSDYPGEPVWVAKKINPPVSESKVRKGIALLEKLGLIARIDSGPCWRMTEKVISTPAEVLSLAIARYHRDVINLAAESIDRFQKPERDIRSVTIGLSEEGLAEAKSRLEAFWREMLDFGGNQTHAQRVYQLNTQLFPLSDEDAPL